MAYSAPAHYNLSYQMGSAFELNILVLFTFLQIPKCPYSVQDNISQNVPQLLRPEIIPQTPSMCTLSSYPIPQKDTYNELIIGSHFQKEVFPDFSDRHFSPCHISFNSELSPHQEILCPRISPDINGTSKMIECIQSVKTRGWGGRGDAVLEVQAHACRLSSSFVAECPQAGGIHICIIHKETPTLPPNQCQWRGLHRYPCVSILLCLAFSPPLIPKCQGWPVLLSS